MLRAETFFISAHAEEEKTVDRHVLGCGPTILVLDPNPNSCCSVARDGHLDKQEHDRASDQATKQNNTVMQRVIFGPF